MCPICGAGVPYDRLNYGTNYQRGECDNGHSLGRIWNAPENPDYDRKRPYGWTMWVTLPIVD